MCGHLKRLLITSLTTSEHKRRINDMETKLKQSKVKGTITEQDIDDVRDIFGGELANRLSEAGEGDTFLNILFEMEKK